MNYVVRRGDTLYGISNQYGVSADDIYKLNNLKSTNLSIGQLLKIPSKSGSNPGGNFTYTVKKGDSLYNIAMRYNTTVNEIVKLNNLKTTSLKIDQKIVIPETNDTVEKLPNYSNYVVKSGDNLYSIARKFNTSVNDIMKDNNLSSSNLNIGQNLKIREEIQDLIIEECYGEEFYDNNTIDYIVKNGDTLYSIAKKFNISVNQIKNNNNLTSNTLGVGQKLKI